MSQPNENDDLSLDFPEFNSESAENSESLGSAEDFADLDFSGFESADSVEPDFSDSLEIGGQDQDLLHDMVPQPEDMEVTVLAPAAAPEPEGGKKGKKAKKEKPPKVKKEKPPKVKKEKPPKKPRDPHAPGLRVEDMVALGACALFAVVFLVCAVFSLGSFIFLILMSIFAAIVIAVPLLLFKFGRESSLFDVGLGIAVIALSIGVILLLAVWSRYDFSLKPSASLNEKQMVSIYEA